MVPIGRKLYVGMEFSSYLWLVVVVDAGLLLYICGTHPIS